MKKLLQITFILAFTFSFGQASLPIYEGFDYTPDAKLFTYSGDLNSSTALGSWVVLRPTTGGVPGPFTVNQDDILICKNYQIEDNHLIPIPYNILFKAIDLYFSTGKH